jgi:hypothetical protein
VLLSVVLPRSADRQSRLFCGLLLEIVRIREHVAKAILGDWSAKDPVRTNVPVFRLRLGVLAVGRRQAASGKPGRFLVPAPKERQQISC